MKPIGDFRSNGSVQVVSAVMACPVQSSATYSDKRVHTSYDHNRNCRTGAHRVRRSCIGAWHRCTTSPRHGDGAAAEVAVVDRPQDHRAAVPVRRPARTAGHRGRQRARRDRAHRRRRPRLRRRHLRSCSTPSASASSSVPPSRWRWRCASRSFRCSSAPAPSPSPASRPLGFWLWFGGLVLNIVALVSNGGTLGGSERHGRPVHRQPRPDGASERSPRRCRSARRCSPPVRPGMTMRRVPFFSWSALITSIALVLVMPVFIGTLVYLFLDHRNARTGFGGNAGFATWAGLALHPARHVHLRHPGRSACSPNCCRSPSASARRHAA